MIAMFRRMSDVETKILAVRVLKKNFVLIAVRNFLVASGARMAWFDFDLGSNLASRSLARKSGRFFLLLHLHWAGSRISFVLHDRVQALGVHRQLVASSSSRTPQVRLQAGFGLHWQFVTSRSSSTPHVREHPGFGLHWQLVASRSSRTPHVREHPGFGLHWQLVASRSSRTPHVREHPGFGLHWQLVASRSSSTPHVRVQGFCLH